MSRLTYYVKYPWKNEKTTKHFVSDEEAKSYIKSLKKGGFYNMIENSDVLTHVFLLQIEGTFYSLGEPVKIDSI